MFLVTGSPTDLHLTFSAAGSLNYSWGLSIGKKRLLLLSSSEAPPSARRALPAVGSWHCRPLCLSHMPPPRSPPGVLPWGSRGPPRTPSLAPVSGPVGLCRRPGEDCPGRGVYGMWAQGSLRPSLACVGADGFLALDFWLPSSEPFPAPLY